MLASARVWADDRPMEAGLYVGGFISNYFHQFYQLDKFPTGDRPLLHRTSPEVGLRYAYFFSDFIGAEAEGSMIIASTQGMTWAGVGDDQGASIYNFRAQAIFQYPLPDLRLYPFAAIGLGLMHTSSDYLGSDTDVPLHVGGGVRWFATPSIALRADLRFLRGPSQQDPYTLNASYGEFMVGVSWVPSLTSEPEAPPPPPPVDGDADGDGILDSHDKCPTEAEDNDLYEDDDGCPDPDNDGDGIADTADKCPLDAEDKDGFQDDDGCPDKDNDFDGVADALDKCPNEPETINGNLDDDGCPDRGDPLVILSPDRLDLLDAIKFRGTAIAKPSLGVLAQVGATMRAHTEIARLRLTVHVQPGKDPDKDMDVSQKRAQALKDWLVQYGIDAKRLEARGFGGTKPLVPPEQRGSAPINERVELIILERR